jgi:hypothetical protein
MAANVFTLAAKAYDAGLVSLTDMTGGRGDTLGFTDADWLFFNAAGTQWTNPEIRMRKNQGGRKIAPFLITAGANTVSTTGNSPASFAHTFTRGTGDLQSGSTTFVGTGGLNVTCTLSQIGNGIGVTFPLSRDLQTFWWLGWVRNATCQASATMSDGSPCTTTPLALPVGAFNVYQPAWFECTFRGTYWQVEAGETVTINVTRTGGASANGQIHSRAFVLIPSVTPDRPKGMQPGSR